MPKPGLHIWNRFPLFKLLFPLMLGIIVAIHLEINIPFHKLLLFGMLLLPLLIVSFYIRKFRTRWLFGLVAAGLIFVLGFLSVKEQQQTILSTARILPSEQATYLVEALENPVEKENSIKVTVNVLAAESLKMPGVKAILYFEKDSLLMQKVQYGNRLLVHTSWQRPQKPTNPEQFDYRTYLERNGITHQAYVKASQMEIMPGTGKSDLRAFVFGLRQVLLKKLKQHGFKDDEFSLAAAILLGKDDSMDPRLRSGFATAGAMHILCVSGLHVGVIFLILDQLLRFLNKRRRGPWVKAVILILMIWFYAAITGLEPSVLRASTMVTFVVIGKTIKRPTSVYNSLAASAFLLLIINPLIITQIGFQLSYLAVLSIVAFQPILYKLWLPSNKILDKMWAITTVSIAAQLGTFPLAVHYFHIFPVYFLITNLLVIPLSSFIIYSGFLFFVLSFVPPLAWLTAKVLWALLWFLKQSVFTIEALPSASLDFLNLNPGQIILLYASLVLVFVWLKTANRRLLFGAIISLFLLSFSFVSEIPDRASQKRLLLYDAGKGLAVEVLDGYNHVVLMDSTVFFDEQFVNYNLKEFWIKQGLDPVKPIRINEPEIQTEYFAYQDNIIAWKDQLIYILDNANIQINHSTNYLVVHDQKASPGRCLGDELPDCIVLTEKVPPWKIDEWKSFADSNDVAFHQLENGYIELN